MSDLNNLREQWNLTKWTLEGTRITNKKVSMLVNPDAVKIYVSWLEEQVYGNAEDARTYLKEHTERKEFRGEYKLAFVQSLDYAMSHGCKVQVCWNKKIPPVDRKEFLEFLRKVD